MAVYTGFSTQDVEQFQNYIVYGRSGVPGTITQPPILRKKFKLTDEQLIMRDFINAFNIKQGDKVDHRLTELLFGNFYLIPTQLTILRQ